MAVDFCLLLVQSESKKMCNSYKGDNKRQTQYIY